ncbi:hypothetical protein IGI04_019883 [Brassica rapa subsp. trilocularis]|uniref:Uncharacterized protein n=1 Tax=Brassica rapa subsp. trilocularis TaxID=1813537 RepID=A0ABQ7MKI6_BRACM|nr:hypothetical protein IGI04_019883 [Brassica rapa subsp. trilocularis]
MIDTHCEKVTRVPSLFTPSHFKFTIFWYMKVNNSLHKKLGTAYTPPMFMVFLSDQNHLFHRFFLVRRLSFSESGVGENTIRTSIRYAPQDFALVTGLNCGESGRFHSEAQEKAIG